MHHTSQATAALHIMLAVAMDRLGVDVLEVTEVDYIRALMNHGDLHVSFDGQVYRAERMKPDGA